MLNPSRYFVQFHGSMLETCSPCMVTRVSIPGPPFSFPLELKAGKEQRNLVSQCNAEVHCATITLHYLQHEPLVIRASGRGRQGSGDSRLSCRLQPSTLHTVWPAHNAAWYCLVQLLTDQQLPFKRAAVAAWRLI